MLCKASLEIVLRALEHFNYDLSVSIAHTTNESLVSWYKFRQKQNDSVIGQVRKLLRSL